MLGIGGSDFRTKCIAKCQNLEFSRHARFSDNKWKCCNRRTLINWHWIDWLLAVKVFVLEWHYEMTELYEETEIEFEFLVCCVVLELNGSSYIMLLLVLTNVLTFTRRSVIFAIGNFWTLLKLLYLIGIWVEIGIKIVDRRM